MTKKKDSEGRIIQSVERAVKALLLFLEDDSELGIKDFSAMLDLPKPTIYSIVNTLTVHNVLEQNPDNSKYHLGPVVFRLGLQYLRHQDFLSTMIVWIERLAFRFSKSVNVCMLISNQMVVIHKVDPDEVIISYPNVGASVSVHNTANGKVLLAYSDKETRDKVLDRCAFDRSTEFTIADRDLLEEELERVRASGVGHNRQEGVIGVSSIAGPIFNHNNQIIASFSIFGSAEYFKENSDKLAAEVRNTAHSISKQLGYRGNDLGM